MSTEYRPLISESDLQILLEKFYEQTLGGLGIGHSRVVQLRSEFEESPFQSTQLCMYKAYKKDLGNKAQKTCDGYRSVEV